MRKDIQAGAIPYTVKDSKVRFLLVTSSRGRWIFPKGHVEAGETKREAALKECQEEAGVNGALTRKLGQVARRKRRTTYYLLRYKKPTKTWRERKRRKRRWVSFKRALRMLDLPGHKKLLEEALAQIKDHKAA